MKIFSSAALAAASLTCSHAAAAQQSVPAGSAQSAPPDVDAADIVVTAQKRSERLQDVPLSITAIDGATLEAKGIGRIDDIARLTPGLNIGSFTPAKPILYLRGIGTRQIGIGADPSVALFVDEVYVGQVSGFLTGLSDIERVEILKGPQGTLYGRNTIGGAISVVTRAPSSTLEGDVEVGIGNRNAIYAKGSVSGPIGKSDRLRARLSFLSSRRDGYKTNVTTGNKLEGEDQTGVRAKVEFDANARLSFLFTASYLRDTAPGQVGKTAGPGLFFRNPFITPPPISADRFSDAYSLDATNRRDIANVALRTRLEGQDVMLTSITGFRRSTLAAREESDNTILDVSTQDEYERVSEISQELRLTSVDAGSLSLGGKLSWIAGLYYFHDASFRRDTFEWGRDSFPVFYASLPAGLTGYTGGPVDRVTTPTSLDKTTNSYAAFAQGRYGLTGNIGLTVGLRYTNEMKKAVYLGETSITNVPPVFFNFRSDLHRHWQSLDPRVTLDYHANRDVIIYATYSRGFKSGGFQFAVASKALSDRIFNPERVNSFEIGIKSQLFDRRLTLNATAFHYDYSDLQLLRLIATPTGASNIVDNVASSTIDGFEIDSRLRVGTKFTVGASYSYLNARFKEYVYDTGQDFSGTPLPRSPRHSFSISGDYMVPVAADQRVSFHADWNYTGKFTHEPGGFGTRTSAASLNSAFVEPSYSLVNVNLAYETGAWRFSAYVSNILDKNYRAAIQDYPAVATPFGDIGSQTTNFWASPRTFGAAIRWKL